MFIITFFYKTCLVALSCLWFGVIDARAESFDRFENKSFDFYRQKVKEAISSDQVESLKFHRVGAVEPMRNMTGEFLKVTLWRYCSDPSLLPPATYPDIKKAPFVFTGRYERLAVLDILEGLLSPREVFEVFSDFSGGSFETTVLGNFLSALPVDGVAISANKRTMVDDKNLILYIRRALGYGDGEHLDLQNARTYFFSNIGELNASRIQVKVMPVVDGDAFRKMFLQSPTYDPHKPFSYIDSIVRVTAEGGESPLLFLKYWCSTNSQKTLQCLRENKPHEDMVDRFLHIVGESAQRVFLSVYCGHTCALEQLSILKELFGDSDLRTNLGQLLWQVPGLRRHGYGGNKETFYDVRTLYQLLVNESVS